MYNVPTTVNGKRLSTAIACVVLLTLFIAGSCKKEEEDFADRFQNKWSLVQKIDSFYSSTSLAPMVTPYEGQTGEYIEFRPDGRMCSYIKKVYDTVAYTFSEQNYKINVQGHTYKVIVLTGNSMVLHEPRYPYGGTSDYNAYKITLKK